MASSTPYPVTNGSRSNNVRRPAYSPASGCASPASAGQWVAISGRATSSVTRPPPVGCSTPSGPSKVLVAGSTNGDFYLARYNANGTLDTTFGSARLARDRGKVTTDLGGGDGVFSLLVDGSGRILATGKSDGVPALARYTADGALDTTFGSGGKLVTTLARDDFEAHVKHRKCPFPASFEL